MHALTECATERQSRRQEDCACERMCNKRLLLCTNNHVCTRVHKEARVHGACAQPSTQASSHHQQPLLCERVRVLNVDDGQTATRGFHGLVHHRLLRGTRIINRLQLLLGGARLAQPAFVLGFTPSLTREGHVVLGNEQVRQIVHKLWYQRESNRHRRSEHRLACTIASKGGAHTVLPWASERWRSVHPWRIYRHVLFVRLRLDLICMAGLGSLALCRCKPKRALSFCTLRAWHQVSGRTRRRRWQ